MRCWWGCNRRSFTLVGLGTFCCLRVCSWRCRGCMGLPNYWKSMLNIIYYSPITIRRFTIHSLQIRLAIHRCSRSTRTATRRCSRSRWRAQKRRQRCKIIINFIQIKPRVIWHFGPIDRQVNILQHKQNRYIEATDHKQKTSLLLRYPDILQNNLDTDRLHQQILVSLIPLLNIVV